MGCDEAGFENGFEPAVGGESLLLDPKCDGAPNVEAGIVLDVLLFWPAWEVVEEVADFPFTLSRVEFVVVVGILRVGSADESLLLVGDPLLAGDKGENLTFFSLLLFFPPLIAFIPSLFAAFFSRSSRKGSSESEPVEIEPALYLYQYFVLFGKGLRAPGDLLQMRREL